MSDWEIVIQGSLCTMLLVSSRWAGILVRFLGENLDADPEPGCPTPCADKPQGLQSSSPGDSAQAKDEMPSPRPTLGFSGSEGHRLLALNELINTVLQTKIAMHAGRSALWGPRKGLSQLLLQACL